jgi:hypothetical protein
METLKLGIPLQLDASYRHLVLMTGVKLGVESSIYLSAKHWFETSPKLGQGDDGRHLNSKNSDK